MRSSPRSCSTSRPNLEGRSAGIKTGAARLVVLALSGLLFSSCAGGSSNGSERSTPIPWRGDLEVYGGLRAMFHEGRTGAMIGLDDLLPDPNLYAVGALADLSGEVTVAGGRAYLSYPDDSGGTRTELATASTAEATLLVAARVSAWRTVTAPAPILFEELDAAIPKLAEGAGLTEGGRFPFLLEGDFEDLRWHVIDGRRLDAGGTSHQDHLAASVQARRDRAAAILVGFYSASDQGVFTHMGSRTHVHCVLEEPVATGHVDHVIIPAGTTIRFPVDGG